MAGNNETFVATIEVNSRQAKSEIEKLQKEIEQKKERLNLLAGKRSKESKKQAEILRAEIVKLNREYVLQEKYVKGLDTVIQGLADKTYNDLRNEVRQLNKLMRDGTIKKHSEEWNEMAEYIKKCKQEMKEYEDAVTEQQPKWQSFFDFLNKNWGALTQIIGAATGLSMTIRKVTNDYAMMEQEMADVRKYTGQTSDEVERMNEDFKKMDTRTSREELNQLAGAAGRLGIIATQQIEEFVDAADKINVALGDDLGDGAVDQIGKLAMAFGEDDRLGLRGAMLATGSAINELAQNSSAQAGYLVDFTARVAGFGKQLGLTQAQIMGFGAVMDENLLRDEMASTAFGNLLTKMQTDTAKFAKIAGKDVKEFTDLLKNDANQAIMALADNLRKQDPQTMMKMLDDMGLDGARAVGVLSTLADKIDDVRDRQKIATEAYREGTSVIEEFVIQNSTVQAELDKAKKRFNDLSIELGEKLLPIVKYTISSSSLIIKCLKNLIDFVVKYQATLVSITIAITALTIARERDVIWTKLQIFWNDKFVKGFKKLIAAVSTNPWSAAGVAIAAVIGVIIDLTRETNAAAKAQKALADIQKQAQKNTVEQEQNLRFLIAAAKDETLSLDERRKAINKLNDIIPGYNAALDETTGKYTENKKALDDYLESLVKQYEIEGAKDKLKELGREKSDIAVEKNKAQKIYDNVKEAGPGFSYTTSWGAVGNTAVDSKSHFKENLERLKAKEKAVDLQIEAITSVYGRELEKAAVKNNEGGNKPTNGNALGYESDAEKRKKETEQKKAEAARKKELKKRAEETKAAYQEELAEEMMRYRDGLSTYTEYMENRHRLTQKFYDNLKGIYGEESTEYRKMLTNREQDDAEYIQWKAKQDENALTREKVLREQSIRRQFYDETNSEAYMNEEAMNEALFQSDMQYMRRKQALYKEGSKEWVELEMQITSDEQQHRFQLEQSYMERLQQYREQAGQMNYDRLMEIELKGVESFYAAMVKSGKMTQDEYEAIVQHIKMKYAELSATQTANTDVSAQASKALAVATKKAGAQESVTGSDAVTGLYSISQAIKQQKLINEQLKELYGEDYENNREYQEAKRQLDAETMQTIVAGAQAAYSSIGSLMSAASSYAQACSDVEVARITANYDKQIEAAGNNTKKKEKLEKQRDADIAKAKNAANKKAMTIEIAQATASTAMAAINAYASAAKIPIVGHTLAPIAAATALAAGALQIATIKKQHEAEAAGYYEGGFTGGKNYRRKAGVVHEGEFVANHNAVNNSNLMPVFDLLDKAQRNNRVGSLTAQDVTNVMGGAAATVVAPVVNVQTDNAELRDGIDGLNEVIGMLKTRLDDGIEAYSVIDGPNGAYKQMKRYERLISKK